MRRNRSRCPKKRAQSSFTLVELLVVITIIAILAALLLPAIRIAKEQAQAAQCMNNLHQLAIGLSLYGQDRGRYPSTYEDNPPGGTSPSDANWAYRLNPYLQRGTNDTFGGGDNSRSPCIVCPSHGKPFTNPNDKKLNYAMNQELGGEQFPPPIYPRPYPYETRPSELILIADAGQAGNNNSDEMLDGHPEWNQPYNAATAENAVATYNDDDKNSGSRGRVTFRHKARTLANVCFVDGHIEIVKRGALKEKHLKMDPPNYP